MPQTAALRRISFAVLLVTGCASTKSLAPGQSARIAHFQQESEKINASENRCISEALASTVHRKAGMAAGASSPMDQQTHQIVHEQDKSLNECRTNAAREKAALSQRERKIYQDDAEEEHDRKSLMMILTSGPR